MDRVLTNRVTMYQTVEDYLDRNNSIWSGMAPFAAAMQQYKEGLVAFAAAAQKQETPVSGAAVDKASTRDALEDVLFLVCEALAVLAHLNNDHELEALVTVTPSGLDKFSDQELSNRATNVLGRANAKKAELAAFQVTQANLDEVAQALDAFDAGKAKPRAAVVERAVQTGTLPALARDLNNILRNKMDRLVNLFRRSHPEFVAGYRSARIIVDRGGSHSPAKKPEDPTTPES